MPRTISLLDRVGIASPCSVPWESMKGDNRIRHCDQCNLNVFNLADMPRIEAERLVVQHEGKICARMYVREDGTYLANDCPIGLRLARRAAARMVVLTGAALVAILQFASTALSIRPDADWARWQKPFDKFSLRFAPQVVFGGDLIVMPPAQPKLPVATPGATTGNVPARP